MAKLNWERVKREKQKYNQRLNSTSKRKTPKKLPNKGSTIHIMAMAHKCVTRMMNDPKNKDVAFEVMFERALKWAISKIKEQAGGQ